MGVLSGGDLSELSGCWNTAKSTVEGRPLVLDVTKLIAVDEAGTDWLMAMMDENAHFLDGHDVTAEIPVRLLKSPTPPSESLHRIAKGRLRSFMPHAQAK